MKRYLRLAFDATSVVAVLGVADVVPEPSVSVPFVGDAVTESAGWSLAIVTGVEFAIVAWPLAGMFPVFVAMVERDVLPVVWFAEVAAPVGSADESTTVCRFVPVA